MAEEVDLRCDNGIKFGELNFGYSVIPTLEVKCRSARCGAARGVVVIHTFDLSTGKMVATDRYRDPVLMKEEG